MFFKILDLLAIMMANINGNNNGSITQNLITENTGAYSFNVC
jgi:hypothetical protein